MSDFLMITPIDITDAKLTSSNVAENDYTAWSSITAYVPGDYVILTTGYHKIYICIVANTNKTPATPANIYDDTVDPATGYWTEVGATNRWKMFDNFSRAATTNPTSIVVVITPGELVNGLGLLNLVADTVNITIDEPTDGEIYNEDVDLIDLTDITDFYEWFFEPLASKSDVVKLDLPAYTTGIITITVTKTGGTAQAGEVVLGVIKTVAITNWGTSYSAASYSEKKYRTDENDNQVAYLDEDINVQAIDYELRIERHKVDTARRAFLDRLNLATLYIGAEDLSETVVYGFAQNFTIVLATLTIKTCSLRVQELRQ